MVVSTPGLGGRPRRRAWASRRNSPSTKWKRRSRASRSPSFASSSRVVTSGVAIIGIFHFTRISISVTGFQGPGHAQPNQVIAAGRPILEAIRGPQTRQVVTDRPAPHHAEPVPELEGVRRVFTVHRGQVCPPLRVGNLPVVTPLPGVAEHVK